jgi:hypothetical protein
MRDIKKQIGNYKIFLKADFKNTNSEYIYLNVSCSSDVIRLIKEIIVPNMDLVYCNFDNSLKRFRVKEPIFNSLDSYYREIPFTEDFIKNSKIELKFNSITNLDNAINLIKTTFKDLINNSLKYKDYSVVVNYSVNEIKNE